MNQARIVRSPERQKHAVPINRAVFHEGLHVGKIFIAEFQASHGVILNRPALLPKAELPPQFAGARQLIDIQDAGTARDGAG